MNSKNIIMGRKKKEIEVSEPIIFKEVKKEKIKVEKRTKEKPLKKVLKEPIKEVVKEVIKEKEYVHGLDSDYIMNHMSKSTWQHPSIELLIHANKDLGTSYKTWNELSNNGHLTESFLTKYETEVNWYAMLKLQKNDNFSEKFKKKYRSKFMLITLELV